MDGTVHSPARALSLNLPTSPGDFDYGVFLQEDLDDLDYLADAGNSTSTQSDSSGNKLPGGFIASPSPRGTPSAAAAAAAAQALSQRQRLERRGHTKSRRGCFNCKRRRIKCQESRPACGHCVKTGLKCEYPALPQVTHQPHHQIPLFSLQDMRFFQHFLLACYPHQPLGNENIWTHEVPCLSQSHEYLMHAILGMSACDLMTSDPSLMAFAMAHRVKAIKAIKKALAEMPKSHCTYEEANALVATCFALTFQSVAFEDGMAEFMTFVRGILIIGMQMWMKGIRPMFANMIGQDARVLLQPHMAALPLIQREWTEAAVSSIQALRPLCNDVTEVEYQERILDMAQKLHVSSWDAYTALQDQYGWWMMLPHERFQRVIDQSNPVMMLLATHWIALQQIMAFITQAEHSVRQKKPDKQPDMDPGMMRWLKYLHKRIEAEGGEWEMYNAWPVWVSEQLERDLGFFGKLV